MFTQLPFVWYYPVSKDSETIQYEKYAIIGDMVSKMQICLDTSGISSLDA